MKKNLYEFPKSSFLGMAKDTALIINKILTNKNILKLIYYTSKDWKDKPDLNSQQIKELFENKQVSNIPKITVFPDKATYLRISYDDFVPNDTNPYYRNHMIDIKIICHYDSWDLGDFELRPYRIAGELDSILDGQHLTGIGELQFLSAEQILIDNEFAGINLRYWAVRGNEDKVNPLS